MHHVMHTANLFASHVHQLRCGKDFKSVLVPDVADLKSCTHPSVLNLILDFKASSTRSWRHVNRRSDVDYMW